MEPRIETLMSKVDSKFTLVTLAAMRAREINDYYNQLGEGLGKIVPPQVTSVSRKPLTISMEEIEAGKIKAVPLPEESDGEADGDDHRDRHGPSTDLDVLALGGDGRRAHQHPGPDHQRLVQDQHAACQRDLRPSASGHGWRERPRCR